MFERFDREATLAIKAALSCALEASRREMRALGTRRIRGEHLLLGLLDSSVAARELPLAFNIDPLALRRTVLRALADGG